MSKSPNTSRVLYGNLLPAPGEYSVDFVHSFVEFSVQQDLIPEKWSRYNVSFLAKSQEGRWSRDGLVLFLLRPGVDEALVQRRGVLGGGSLGVLA
jgi:hypothetical protein